jgi:hypothetical protein
MDRGGGLCERTELRAMLGRVLVLRILRFLLRVRQAA